MRRLGTYIGIILLALLLGGWGGVIAATLCPHAGASASPPMAEDHACCRAKSEHAGLHHSTSHHGAAHGAKPGRMPAAHQLQGRAALGQPRGACAHCMGQRDLPATIVGARELTSVKRGDGEMVAPMAKLEAAPVAVAVSHFVPQQHAPPQSAGRKHLLLSVFLI